MGLNILRIDTWGRSVFFAGLVGCLITLIDSNLISLSFHMLIRYSNR